MSYIYIAMKQMINIKRNCWVLPSNLIFFVTLLFLLSACDKRDNPVPTARFTVTINLSLPDYNKEYFILNYDPYNHRTIGISGILIVRGATNDGTQGYNAFERFCPHDQKISCKVNFDDDFTTATCPCCESQFFIGSFDGDIIKGPTDYPLKTYKTRLEGRRLTIYN